MIVAEFMEQPEIREEVRRIGIDLALGYCAGRLLPSTLPESHWPLLPIASN